MFLKWLKQVSGRPRAFLDLVDDLDQLMSRAALVENELLQLASIVPSRDQRRRYLRLRCDIATQVEIDGRLFWGKIIDVGLGGMMVETETPVLVSQKIKLEFSLPRSRALVSLRGVVRWYTMLEPIDPGAELSVRFGVEFSSDTLAQEHSIQRLILVVVREHAPLARATVEQSNG